MVQSSSAARLSNATAINFIIQLQAASTWSHSAAEQGSCRSSASWRAPLEARPFCISSGQPRAGFRVGQQVPSKWADPMPRYFFDTMDSGRLICDESGIELPSIQAARAEAARSLADIALDMSPNDRREVVVEVSDEEGAPSSGPLFS